VQAGVLIEKHAQGDRIGVRHLGQVFRRLVVERELVLLREEQDSRRRECLLMEPTAKRVSGVTAIFEATAARPYPLEKTTLPCDQTRKEKPGAACWFANCSPIRSNAF
jgi:hypothetical protein